jgi:hypothetical protein
MPELFQDEITASFGGDDFIFSIPSLHDEIRIGLQARALRQALAGPGGDPSENGLDEWTLYFLRASATFEILLKKASAKWPWVAGAGGPVVDSSKFPKDKVGDVVAIYRRYLDELATFREGGTPSKPASTEAVADKPDTSEVPV